MSDFKVGDRVRFVAPWIDKNATFTVDEVGREFLTVRDKEGKTMIERKYRAVAANASAKFKLGDRVYYTTFGGSAWGTITDYPSYRQGAWQYKVDLDEFGRKVIAPENKLSTSAPQLPKRKFAILQEVEVKKDGAKGVVIMYDGLRAYKVSLKSGGKKTFDEDELIALNARACNAITGRLPNGMQANDAVAELGRYADRLVQEADKYSPGRHGRRGVSALVDRRTGAVQDIKVHVQTGGAYSQMKDKIESELKAIGRKFGATDTNAFYWKGDTELTLKFPAANSRACNSTNPIVRKAMNAKYEYHTYLVPVLRKGVKDYVTIERVADEETAKKLVDVPSFRIIGVTVDESRPVKVANATKSANAVVAKAKNAVARNADDDSILRLCKRGNIVKKAKMGDLHEVRYGAGYIYPLIGKDGSLVKVFGSMSEANRSPLVNAVAKNYKPTSEFEVGDTVRFKDSVRSVPHDETYKVVKVYPLIGRIIVKSEDGKTSDEFVNNLEIV